MITFTVGDKYDPVGWCGEMWERCVISPVPALVSRACVGSTGFQGTGHSLCPQRGHIPAVLLTLAVRALEYPSMET